MRTKKIKNDMESETSSNSPTSQLQMQIHIDDSTNINNSVINIDNKIDNNVSNPTIATEKKKRGRKKLIRPDEKNNQNESEVDEIVNVVINNTLANDDNTLANDDNTLTLVNDNNINVDTNKKKTRKPRVSKKQDKMATCIKSDFNGDESVNVVVENDASLSSSSSTLVHKKRGRKPRGGKIIHENHIQNDSNPEVPNIILHLKCVLSDLKKSNELMSNNKLETYSNDKKLEVLCYNDNDQNAVYSSSSNVSSMTKYERDNADNTSAYAYNNDGEYTVKEIRQKEQTVSASSSNIYDSLRNIHPTPVPITETKSKINPFSFSFSDNQLDDGNDCDKNGNHKDIWKKISQLKLSFHKNDALSIQRSACFWDTCEFDTPPIYIPMSTTKGYGCFCHPECAVAFLMNENIDTSVKFERYFLLNSIYGPIYNYNKSIKPAANPHFLLSKFYGNLSINEYRKLFQSEQIVYMVNKPLTNVLPELYEDNNDFFIGNKVIQNSTIEIKKKVSKNAKSSIINEVFGIKQ